MNTSTIPATAIPTDYFAPIASTQLEVRLAMIANGYNPTPLFGKRPFLDGWQNITATAEIAREWGGSGTGMVTVLTPVFDVDILDERAAQIAGAMIRSLLGSEGHVLERIGQPPKRAFPARTDVPFKKIVRKFTAPDGRVHKIEVLGDGQQLAVAGIHPDTGKPFVWRDGKSPVIGWVEGERATAPGLDFTSTPQPDPTYVPQEERFKQTEIGGKVGLNQTLLELPMRRLDDSIPLEDVMRECKDLSRTAWEALPRGSSRKEQVGLEQATGADHKFVLRPYSEQVCRASAPS
jgi:hypothetical protein